MLRSCYLLAAGLLLSLLGGPALAQQPVQAIIRTLKDPKSKQVLVVAHRADWRHEPENSLRGIESAITLGVDMVEIDLKKSKDGVLILLHDQTLDRTTSGHGRPADYTWAELQQLTLKSAHGGPTRQRIPSFEQCMLAAKGRVMVNIDKGYDYFQEAYEVLVKTGTVDHAVIKSAYPYDKVKAEHGALLTSQLLYMPIVDLQKPEATAVLREYETKLRPVAYELNFPTDSALLHSAYQSIPATGSKIWYNSLWASLDAGHDDERSVEENRPADGWGWLLAHGATLLQTDRPAELLAYLRQRKLHR
ncbi:glycerophosphodiester phosphodiesterase family protein [Hymenobacter sp. RP-2-7]|uniref:Glycerophosphodiester phosphodiesterase family protein n=1 Tax=Hymenobacter polaris TaxID=2682546 RepID=A0A7Y0FLG1_9BACT|nr:glycerophosphodiester phosphodiesterase family protein [Hymenobacter polaris]NML64349.1 glycerophosphodiester phosphodiesterase family protein [Hymenobacter polaris]